MPDDLVIDVPVSPQEAEAHLAAALGKPPRRVLGVLKVENEFVGVVNAREFEVWERRQHAVHATGRIDARSEGSRVRANFHVTPRTRVLVIVFFVLYALGALVVMSLERAPSEPTPPPLLSGVLLAGGAIAIASFFAASARSQRAELRRFLGRVFPVETSPTHRITGRR